MAQYRAINQEVKKGMKKAKENWIGEQCQNIGDCLKKNNSKKAYKLVQDLTGTKRERIPIGPSISVFIDFKKAFNRVWYAALWATMRLYNTNTNLINAIQNLYDKATSAVCFNGSTGGWFRTTVGVRQGCLLAPTLFNIFLERIMADALEDHKSTVSIGDRTISNLRFSYDIDGLAGSE